MYHKLSNTASRTTLEKEFNRRFKYPNLFQKQVLINGIDEVTIPIIPMEEADLMVPAIWGLLPEGYKDEWSVFQDIFNSLNLNIHSLSNPSWYSNALLQRRCLIPVTGFFTSYLIDGILYPYYFRRRSGLPFCLTGIYNKLDDGFLTCSIITTHTNHNLKAIQNIDGTVPMMLSKDQYNTWLNQDLNENDIQNLLNATPNFRLIAHPISKEFFKNNISYTSMLEPVYYEAAPTGMILKHGVELLSL
ncbi:SOS response-associated peptidase [Arenibacter sp. F26102]|uniref:SOS response-associated peptidase n=1 Tax=Arenibacter sp. F26102 TaxID=2926416 RepID=UPI001FF27BFB|nr:SOS response-associated peptidase family protein [Arenibacter sp. F26102]MCK0144893.1 SOS response-associated peptidase [Arenibacter sp. F26102]